MSVNYYDPKAFQEAYSGNAKLVSTAMNHYGYGIHGTAPRSTPKYLRKINIDKARRRDLADDLYTTARLFIDLNDKRRDAFIISLPQELAEAATALTTSGYVDFFLTSVAENYSEKVLVSQTLSDAYAVYFSGQAPPTLSVSGLLMNSLEDEWRIMLTRLYQHALRGTMLARNQTSVHLKYDDQIVSGFVTDFRTMMQAEMQVKADFAFNMLVRKVTYLPTINYSTTKVPSAFFSDSEGNPLPDHLRPISVSIPSKIKISAVAPKVTASVQETHPAGDEGPGETDEWGQPLFLAARELEAAATTSNTVINVDQSGAASSLTNVEKAESIPIED